MESCFPSEDQVSSLNVNIKSLEDVQLFLMKNEPNKQLTDRFICWLVKLGILQIARKELWTQVFCDLMRSYSERSSFYFGDDVCKLSVEEEVLIRNDLDDYDALFPPDLNDIIKDPKAFLFHIFCIMVKENANKWKYSSNYAVFGYIIVELTARVAQDANLNINFVEAISYKMIEKLIDVVSINNVCLYLRNKMWKYFDYVDLMIKSYSPNNYRIIKSLKSSSMYFGIKLENTLFASLHMNNTVNIMNIWDQILCRIDRYHQFLQSLIVAHIMQLKLTTNVLYINDYILNYRDWDLSKLILDATMILKNPKMKTCCFFKI